VSGKLVAAGCLAVGSIVGLFAPSGASGSKDPGCIYGKVLDGHTGKIRCLSPEEVSPPGPFDTPVVDAGVDAEAGAPIEAGARRDARADTPIPLVPLSVTIEALTFEGGDVPRAPAALDRIKKDFLQCAVDRPAVKVEATATLRFLVRAPGKAEGVDVGDVHGMSADMVRCMRSTLAGRSVGAPSTDPVGVSFTLHLR
jgi:hypothetical protein